MKSRHKVILWDFDGVLMNSNEVRDLGFEKVLVDYPKEQVAKLMQFHRNNGGLSRYVKFRFFFEEVLKQTVIESEIQELAASFSVIMKELLTNKELLIKDSLNFVKKHYSSIPMHIVSGSDQSELRYLCKTIRIDTFFKSIHGSPTPKNTLVKEVIESNGYPKAELVLIGDSINDYEAAKVNGIDFYGYNNPKFSPQKMNIIDSFLNLEFVNHG
jgi:phosphoglycolate phosphatase-like HAD superfamily hydrolase